jgi:energy-coupling factor transport system ATP-binding protein
MVAGIGATMTIRFENIWFAYESFAAPGNRSKPQLQDISFEIRAGELVGLVGRSGSGKTTLMQMFNGLLLPERGRVLVDEHDINLSDYDLTALRRRLGVVFQFPEMHLFAATVEEEIAFGPQQQNLPAAEIAQRVTLALQQVGLDESFSGRNPFTLSQGEKRRVALAGVLAMQPEMLVLDEPTASLDARGALEARRLLRDWHSAGKTLVIISHDIDLIARLCPRLLVLNEGRLIYDGPTASLWEMAGHDLLQQAGLPWPRYQRLRRVLTSGGISCEGISILKDGQNP